jgi:hypothetical protein
MHLASIDACACASLLARIVPSRVMFTGNIGALPVSE